MGPEEASRNAAGAMMALFWKIFFWRLPLPIGPVILACLALWGFSQLERGIAINSAVKSAVKELVAGAEITALKAKADEIERQRKAGQIVIDSYQVQLNNLRTIEALKDEEREQEIANYEKLLKAAGRSCALTDADRRFLLDP